MMRARDKCLRRASAAYIAAETGSTTRDLLVYQLGSNAGRCCLTHYSFKLSNHPIIYSFNSLYILDFNGKSFNR